ncbi:MAG: GlxA family transcriptional regulator [Rhodospirillaceae bacterium]|nr:GlxA family transcriptional regulator [Rhodospirillaceae bacterium]MBT5913653.1 GlxA family transcriptional regulator [Rhodospirillaceae bacterium]MBT6305868.1 GlxA family transcriptional regulator [Rhodospirillaceae bacterium]MDC0998994.1 GlxA family transcriptional regulator [Alphaproteobacteria bacterium]
MFDNASEVPLQIDFLLIKDFSMMAFTSAIEPLRLANRVAEKELYRWRIISLDGNSVEASNGAEILIKQSAATIENVKIIFVVSGVNVQMYEDERLFAFLRRISRLGSVVGALCTGAHLLAKAGLLNDRRCTIHWENLGAFRELFPEIEVSADIYEVDKNRITCSGGTAGLDMMLFLIGKQHGDQIVAEITEQFIHDKIREPHDQQRTELRTRIGITHPKLLIAVGDMESNLEDPLGQTELALRAGLSTRQLERLFRKYMSMTPTRYYLNLRLKRANQLLYQTTMSILTVALACGFVSASHFSKCYKEYYTRSPREERLRRFKLSRE